MHLCDLYGHFPCVVFRHIFILIAVLVLLVDHNDAGVRKRREKSGPRADNHIDLAPARPLELVCLLAGRKS